MITGEKQSKSNKLNIYYQNVCGLNSKTHDLYTSVLAADYDCIALTETWLSDKVSNNELFPDNYVIFRVDRNLSKTNKSTGGGVLLAVREFFKVEEIHLDCKIDCVDLVCVKINSNNCFYTSLYVLVIYCPPSISGETFEIIFEYLCNLQFMFDSNCITGRFKCLGSI